MTAASAQSDYPLEPAFDFLQCLWRLNRSLEKASSDMEKKLGITSQQRFVVRCVGKYPGMTSGQLAEVLHVDPGTVSATVRRLEEKGLVERRRDPRDHRRVFLGLTARGRAFDRPTEGTVEYAVDRLLATTRASDVEVAKSVIDALTHHLRTPADEQADVDP